MGRLNGGSAAGSAGSILGRETGSNLSSRLTNSNPFGTGTGPRPNAYSANGGVSRNAAPFPVPVPGVPRAVSGAVRPAAAAAPPSTSSIVSPPPGSNLDSSPLSRATSEDISRANSQAETQVPEGATQPINGNPVGTKAVKGERGVDGWYKTDSGIEGVPGKWKIAKIIKHGLFLGAGTAGLWFLIDPKSGEKLGGAAGGILGKIGDIFGGLFGPFIIPLVVILCIICCCSSAVMILPQMGMRLF